MNERWMENFDFDSLREKLTLNLDKELLEAIANMTNGLLPHLPRYDTLISDDASGRLPTLLIWNIAKKIRSDQELPTPKVYFINGGRNLVDWELYPDTSKQLKGLCIKYKGKINNALVITEYIQSGNSIKALLKFLENNQIIVDVATVSSTYEGSFNHPNVLFFSGNIGIEGTSFHGKPEWAGITSPDGRIIAAAARNVRYKRELFRSARQDMKTIASELLNAIGS